jgi:hypothetical protein
LLGTLNLESPGAALRSLGDHFGNSEGRWNEHLPDQAIRPVFDRLRRAAGALDQAADELDEALESIAPDVADGWQAALERILRRLPHGMG